jgi:hypothetical protein
LHPLACRRFPFELADVRRTVLDLGVEALACVGSGSGLMRTQRIFG